VARTPPPPAGSRNGARRPFSPALWQRGPHHHHRLENDWWLAGSRGRAGGVQWVPPPGKLPRENFSGGGDKFPGGRGRHAQKGMGVSTLGPDDSKGLIGVNYRAWSGGGGGFGKATRVGRRSPMMTDLNFMFPPCKQCAAALRLGGSGRVLGGRGRGWESHSKGIQSASRKPFIQNLTSSTPPERSHGGAELVADGPEDVHRWG